MRGRNLLRTDTTLGKVISVCAWAGLTFWFVPHFVNGPLQKSPRRVTLGSGE